MRIFWKKCPKCKETLETGTHGDVPLGEMFVVCPRCNTLIKTGRKEWILMTKLEKAWFIFRSTFIILFFTGGLVLVLWAAQEDHDYDPLLISSISILVYLFVSISTIRDCLKMVSESKERMSDTAYMQALKELDLYKN